MPVELDNLTETLQRHLGLQQAQTFDPENITADAIARLTGRRGDLARLIRIWEAPAEAARELVDGGDESQRQEFLSALRRMLDSALVINTYKSSGLPKTFRPFNPLFVSAHRVGNLYRDMGRSVAESLWNRPGLTDVRGVLAQQVQSWALQHPLALLLQPLCEEVPAESARDVAQLAFAIEADDALKRWVDGVVVQDWKAWLKAAARLSVDEQVETMTGLIGLHLHVALLWRLGDTVPLGTTGERDRCPPFFFIAVEGQQHEATGSAYQACLRSAYNFLGFWRERALRALEVVARQAVDRGAGEDGALRRALRARNWTDPRVWSTIPIQGGRRTARATAEFSRTLKEQLGEHEREERRPEEETLRRLVVESLARPFSGDSSVVDKVKDFLRGTGRAAGIVGPNDARSRRRYLFDERGLSLLAHLHACRLPEEVLSTEEDPASIEAFLDDLFSRYGMVVTTERSGVRDHLARGDSSRKLLSLLPSDESARRNRVILDRRLDALRLVRRYSDASAVIVPLV
jgi:hypothetical protein